MDRESSRCCRRGVTSRSAGLAANSAPGSRAGQRRALERENIAGGTGIQGPGPAQIMRSVLVAASIAEVRNGNLQQILGLLVVQPCAPLTSVNAWFARESADCGPRMVRILVVDP